MDEEGKRNVLDDLGRDGLARTAPCGEAVEDHKGALLVDG